MALQDELLIKRLKVEDMQAFEEIIERYKNYVGAVVKSRIVTSMEKEDMEEVIADVFFELWKRRKQLDSKKGSIKNYLGVIARNMAINKLRERKNTVVLEDYLLTQESDSLELQILSQESIQILEGEIHKLKNLDREIFIKYHINGESINQISSDMNMSPNTVKSKLARSRKRLRKQLLERGFLYEG